MRLIRTLFLISVLAAGSFHLLAAKTLKIEFFPLRTGSYSYYKTTQKMVYYAQYEVDADLYVVNQKGEVCGAKADYWPGAVKSISGGSINKDERWGEKFDCGDPDNIITSEGWGDYETFTADFNPGDSYTIYVRYNSFNPNENFYGFGSIKGRVKVYIDGVLDMESSASVPSVGSMSVGTKYIVGYINYDDLNPPTAKPTSEPVITPLPTSNCNDYDKSVQVFNAKGVSSSSIKLTWSELVINYKRINYWNTPDLYCIERKNKGEGEDKYRFIRGFLYNITSREYVDNGLEPGTQYDYRIYVEFTNHQALTVNPDYITPGQKTNYTKASAITQSQLSISAPSANIQIPINTTYNITWNDSCTESSVKPKKILIELYQNNVLKYKLAKEAANSGTFAWTVTADYAAGSGYQAVISDINNSNNRSISPEFQITLPPTIKITEPDAKNILWFMDTPRNVSWVTNYIFNSLQLDLLDSAKVPRLNTVNITPDNTSQSLSYQIPKLPALNPFQFYLLRLKYGDYASAMTPILLLPPEKYVLTGQLTDDFLKIVNNVEFNNATVKNLKFTLTAYGRIDITNNSTFDTGNLIDLIVDTKVKFPDKAPENLTVTQVRDDSAELKWSYTANQAIGYKIYRKGYNESDYDIYKIIQTDEKKYLDTPIEMFKTYSYKVTAFNQRGESPKSKAAGLTVSLPVPDIPSDLTADLARPPKQGIELTWKDVKLETDYILYRKGPGDTQDYILKFLPADTVNYIDQDVAPDTVYQYTLAAKNDGGTGGKTAPVTIRTGSCTPAFTHLKCSLDLSDDRWIPNTGDGTAFEVKIWGSEPTSDQVFPLTAPWNRIVILPPADPNFDATDAAAESNINRNRGTCQYELYTETGSSPTVLATFSRNPDGNVSNANQNNAYTVTYNSQYFNNNGTVKSEYQTVTLLRVNSEGKLEFEEWTKKTTAFKIRVKGTDSEICPGDDLLLRFTLADYDGNLTGKAIAPENQYLAVYDKKMLWRANLYINETEEDWNDLHRWNSADNEWNKVYNDLTRLNLGANMTDLTGLVGGNGGQTVQRHPYRGNPDDPYRVAGIVMDAEAYSYGCHDTPFDFNAELDEQRAILGDAVRNNRTYNGIQYGQFGPNWGLTIPPQGMYNNYVRPVPQNGTPTSATANQNFVTVVPNTPQYFPYLPGRCRDSDPGFWVNATSSGTDCVGLVNMAKNYNGNNYKWDNITRRHYPGDSGTWRELRAGFPTTERQLSWEIFRKSSWTTYTENGVTKHRYPGLEKVVPGDVIYYPATGTPKHVFMVQSVELEPDGKKTNPELITIIEATWWRDSNGRYAKVVNTRTLDVYTQDQPNNPAPNWKVVRLITK